MKEKHKNFGRKFKYFGHKVFPRNNAPFPVALSVALGIFIGVLPTVGVAIPLTVLACIACRIPKAPGVTSSFVAIPPTLLAFFYPIGYGLGHLILAPPAIKFDLIDRVMSINLSNIGEIVSDLWLNSRGHLLAFLLGVSIVAFISASIGFWTTYVIVSKKRNKFLANKKNA